MYRVYCDLFICDIFAAHTVSIDYLIGQFHHWVTKENCSKTLCLDLSYFIGLEIQQQVRQKKKIHVRKRVKNEDANL